MSGFPAPLFGGGAQPIAVRDVACREPPLSVLAPRFLPIFLVGMSKPPKPSAPRPKIASGVSFVDEPDYRVPLDAGKPPPKAKSAQPLDEVERALALLDDRHPDAIRVERETQAALAAKKAAADARARSDQAADRRLWLLRAAIAVAVIVPIVAAWVLYSRRADRAKGVLAALAPAVATFASRGFVPMAASRFADESIDLEVSEPTCFIAMASRAPGDGALTVERPAGRLEGEGSIGWCTCGAEAATVRLRDPSTGGLAVLRAGAADLGGSHGLFFLDPRPHVVAAPLDCGREALDAWIDKAAAVRAKDDALDEELRATLGRAGFAIAGSAPATLPFAIVPGAADSCALAWSSVPRDVLSLRLRGGARPLEGVTGALGFCGSRAESVTVWREGVGELVVERVSASRVGGTHGLREAPPRLGLPGAATAWVSEDDLAWDATAALRASGTLPAEISVSTDGQPVKKARIVALSIAGATVLADAGRDAGYACEPTLGPTSRSAVCVQSAALPWRTVGAIGKAGIAEGTLPFWMEAVEGAVDPRALAAQLNVLKLGRRLLMDGFEATTRDGVTEVEGGALVTGRGGSDGVVVVQLSHDPPWASPCTSGDVWSIDGAPGVVSLAPDAQVRLACAPRAAREHRTVVFRHVAAKPSPPR